MSLPVLIIGQGLAGTALAWRLWERGAPFLVVDRAEPGTCSKIAAGLLTPITGMRLTLDENYGAWLCEAVKFYRSKERLLGGTFLHARRHVRLFKNDGEPAKWAKRKLETDVRAFVRVNGQGSLVDDRFLSGERGGFEMKHAGWLDTRGYLEASRAFFEKNGCWMQGEIPHAALDVAGGRVRWEGREFGHAALCTGWEAMRHPWFDWVPFEPARGTILTVRAELGGERRVIHSGCWVQPREDGSLRVGSTFEVGFTDPRGFDAVKVEALEKKLRGLVRAPVEVLAREAAVRPAIAGQRTLIGRHPGREQVLFFNGLGSKGALRAPSFARRLVAHVLDGEALPPAMDVRGNL